MDMQQKHFAEVTAEIYEDLNDLSRRYDAKVLAIVMMTRGAHLLRVLQCLGVMDANEVNNTIITAVQDVHTPLAADELPETKMVGKPARLS